VAADIKQITIDILESVTSLVWLIVGLAGVMYVSKPRGAEAWQWSGVAHSVSAVTAAATSTGRLSSL